MGRIWRGLTIENNPTNRKTIADYAQYILANTPDINDYFRWSDPSRFMRTPFYDLKIHQMSYKARPALVLAKADAEDYVILPVSSVLIQRCIQTLI